MDCPYNVLGVSPNATFLEIKKSYRKEILFLHPDRHFAVEASRNNVDISNENEAKRCKLVINRSSDTVDVIANKSNRADQFTKVQKAWEILRNSNTRLQYDQTVQHKIDQTERISLTSARDERSLDDFKYNEENDSFTLSCRCGGTLFILASELEDGYDIVECSDCSVIVRILYDIIDE